MNQEDVVSKVAHLLKMAGEDPMWDRHAEVPKDVCSIAAGIIYGQKARILDIQRRMNEMQVLMSKMAMNWRAESEARAVIDAEIEELMKWVNSL